MGKLDEGQLIASCNQVIHQYVEIDVEGVMQRLKDGYSLGGVSLSAFMRTPTSETCVKNGFSNLTKEQEGRYRRGNDITNDHQEKALRDGCHEREWAQMSVSSRGKNNTKRNLARVTTKSKSRTQTVSNGRVSQ